MTTLFMVGHEPGYSPQISSLVGMLAYARYSTLKAVQGCSLEQLDFVPQGLTNSVAMLLAHMAAVEECYQVLTFEDRDLTGPEYEAMKYPLDLGPEAGEHLKGKPLEHYLGGLERVRTKTLEEFTRRDDAWLLEPLPCPWEEGAQWTRLFQWFHVMEDEVNHRGQIRLLSKLSKYLEGS